MIHKVDARDLLDVVHWQTSSRLEKYEEDIAAWLAEDPHRDPADFTKDRTPYEVIEVAGNIFLNAGVSLLADLLIGAGGTVFSNANAHIGVGNSNTAAVATQTDLQGASKFRKPMDATFPSRSAQTLTFKATFAAGDAQFAWEEWGIFNASSSGTMLNRKVQSHGTKPAATWIHTVTTVPG